MFNWHSKMTDVKPYLTELPDVKESNCDCSFCWMVFYIGGAELTEGDKRLYRLHLKARHGLTPDPTV